MRRLLLTFLFPIVGLSQNYVGDHEGNIYDWVNYGTHDWSVKNAENSTYRDGTEIPQVTDPTAWSNLTTGAWRYNDDDPNKEKLYNWYAIVGIHDNDVSTPNKTFAPAGWSVPSDSNWDDLENYLISNGYNYDNTTTGNKIGKAMASNSGWNGSGDVGDVGNDQSSNNSSGFNASWSSGSISANGEFNSAGNHNSFHWTSSESTEDSSKGGFRDLYFNAPSLNSGYLSKNHGFSVRLIKTAISTTNDNGLIMHFPFDGNNDEVINNTPVNYMTTFSNWHPSEPNNVNGGTENRGMIIDSGFWNDHKDGNSNPDFIMESDTDLGILNGYNSIGEFNNHFYYQSTSNFNWTNAKNEAESKGGYLTIINSQAENDFIVENANITIHGTWIGMYQDENASDYSEPSGGWYWIDGTPVEMSKTYADDRNGNTNSSILFDGTDDNYFNGNMPELLDDDYTYSMWIKPLETTSKTWFFVFGENGTASHIGFFQDKLRIGTWGTDGLDTGYAGFSEWKHVLVTFDKTSNTHTLYVNGQQDFSGTRASSFISTYFQIGSQIDNLHEAFNGYMDDLMVWNRVLSQTEITQAYNGTLSLSKTLDFLNIYPNPTSSIINIDYEFSIAKVFDLTGRKVLESRLKTIDLSELPNSIYLLRLYDNSNNVLGTSKVIKK